MLSNAPVAFLCTLMSLDLASLVSGPRAPDLAILALFSSCVARLVMQPTALHCTSTLGDIIWRIRGGRPLSRTIETLFSARGHQRNEEPGSTGTVLLTARLPKAALAAMSGFCNRNKMGSRVSLLTSRTSRGAVLAMRVDRHDPPHKPRSVISANVRAALRCKSTLSE